MRVYVDAAPGRGLVAIAPEGVSPFTLHDPSWTVKSSNWLEHQAIYLGLGYTLGGGPGRIEVLSDSQLAVRQLNGEYATRALSLLEQVLKTRKLIERMKANGRRVKITWVARENNPAGILLG